MDVCDGHKEVLLWMMSWSERGLFSAAALLHGLEVVRRRVTVMETDRRHRSSMIGCMSWSQGGFIRHYMVLIV